VNRLNDDMTSLTNVLVATQPRERAGARTGARFAFQIHASLAKLLELHEAGADYRALFDHFDDLTVLAGSTEPIGMNFFQIKGRESGQWKTTHLCAASGDVPRTTIGKMYHHAVAFGDQVISAVFLTNAAFDFALAAGGISSPANINIAFDELAPKVRAAFAAALEPDFPSPRTPAESDVVAFERTLVPLQGYDTFVKGRLTEFFGDQADVPVPPLYRTLVAEITARSNDITVCSTVEELYARKSLARSDLESVFHEAQKHRNIMNRWQSVEDELKAAGRPLPIRLRLQTAVTIYLRNRSKRMPEAASLHSALKRAAALVAEEMSHAASLCDAVDLLAGQVASEMKAGYDELMWEAGLLVEAFDAVNGQ
jgi:hypothetical protein